MDFAHLPHSVAGVPHRFRPRDDVCIWCLQKREHAKPSCPGAPKDVVAKVEQQQRERAERDQALHRAIARSGR